MESEEEEIQAPTLPEYPVQSRTLFHYFSKVSAEKEKSVPKTPNNGKNRQTGSKETSGGSTSEKLPSIVTSNDQLKVENSIEEDRKADLDNKTTRKKSSPAKGKKKKRVSGKSNSIELENTPDLENKTPNKKPSLTESKKKKRASEKSKETEEYSETVPAPKRVKSTNTVSTVASKDDSFENKQDIRTSKGINSFFKQVTKEEFRKECDRESEKIKLTITALVHTPEVYIEQTSNEVPNDDKKVKATASDEKIIPEPSRKVPVRKSISNVARPNSETDIIKIISHEEVNTEKPRERSSEQIQSMLVTSKDSITNAPKDSQRIDPKTDSVGKNKGSVIRKDTTKDNYDKKETLKVCLFKKKDPPKKKYSRKAKTSVKANNVNGIAHVNYDGDSIDLDLLATYNAKTFHTAATGETGSNNYSLDSSSDESKNAFAALMKKPLTQKKSPKTSSPNCSQKRIVASKIDNENNTESCENLNKSTDNKENKISNSCDKTSIAWICNENQSPNAFTKLMLVQKEISITRKSAAIKENDLENSKDEIKDTDNSLLDFVNDGAVPKSFSHKNVSENGNILNDSILLEHSILLESEDSQDSKSANRRSSRRIKKNKELAQGRKLEPLHCDRQRMSLDATRKPKEIKSKYVKTQKKIGDKRIKLAGTEKHLSDIAPIFLLRKRRKTKDELPKPIEDPEDVAARKLFLLSSVPQVLRDQLDLNKEENESMPVQSMAFPTISHVKQVDECNPYWNLKEILLQTRAQENFKSQKSDDWDNNQISYFSTSANLPTMKQSLSQNNLQMSMTKSMRLSIQHIYETVKKVKLHEKYIGKRILAPSIIAKLKSENSSSEQSVTFPVGKVFRRYLERKLDADNLEFEAKKKNITLNEMEEQKLLNDRKNIRRSRRQSTDYKKSRQTSKEPPKIYSKVPPCASVSYDPNITNSINWTMKYAPKIIDDVIGNSVVGRKLLKWLTEWEETHCRIKKKRQLINPLSDSSESDSDFSSSTDSGSEEENTPSIALLVGPNGIGKTATVYALAHEMGFKVLELNASSTRSGRQVLANLREATQSHSVKKREKASEEECLKNLNSKKINNKVVSNDQDKSVDKTTVILFEDIDIVFDDLDEGFHSAINNLIATTKRPIVLTTSSQNFMACNKNKVLNLKCLPQVFEFRPVQPRIISKYLQLLCLVEGFYINFDSILGLVLSKKGNISASMHQLQYDLSLYGSSGHEVPELYMKYVTDSITKIQFIGGTQIAANKDSTCKPIEKEDSLAKLLSINVTSQDCGSAIYSLLHCSLSLIGLELDTAMAHICNIARKRESISLLNNYKVLNKLLSDGFFDLFDCNRHILLPFRQVVHEKRHARSTPYPLTIKIDNSDSNITSTTSQRSDASRTEKSKRNYRRIINNDSLLMAESEDNSTADEGCQINTESCKEKSIPKNKDISEAFDSTETKAESTIEKNDVNRSSREANTASSEQEDRNRSGIKQVAKENAKHAIDILSQYTDYMSNYIPLQDDQAYWLANNHKLTSCSSPLCSNSNFHDSCMVKNNILTNMFGSNRNEYFNGQQTMLTQEITSSVIQMAVKLAQNSINELIPKETSFLELSVSYPTYYPTQDLVTEEATPKGKEETSLEDMCASHSNEKNDENKIGCEDLKGKRLSFSRDLVVEASTNNDFERGFDLNHVRQLHNAEREVLGSFFPEPLTNISRAIIQDTMPAIRGMARLEEHRKASGLGTSMKRTSRSKFLHYFETQNLYSMRSQTVLNTLCNSFQE